MKIGEEKEYVVSNMEAKLGSLNEQNKTMEERLFKQENLIDRLTRDKITLISELETYKNKCNSLDFDAHQVSYLSVYTFCNMYACNVILTA